MAKTELTLTLEKKIYKATARIGLFSCFEVSIGFNSKERVDYITYDTKGVWRCYEIKASESDFNSKAKKSFVGNYNYYVMPIELYEKVKDKIPANIGVHDGDRCLKNPKKQDVQVDEGILKDSLIRSLYRDAEKLQRLDNPNYISQLKSKIKKLTEEKSKLENHLKTMFRLSPKSGMEANDEHKHISNDKDW